MRELYLIWALLLFFISSVLQDAGASAQSDTTGQTGVKKYLIFRKFISYNNLKATKISNLLYHGPGVGVSNDGEVHHPNWRFRYYTVSMQFNYLRSYKKNTDVFAPRADAGFWAYKKVADQPKQRLFAGASLRFIANGQIIPDLSNSGVYTEIFPFLQVSGWYEKDFRLLKQNTVLYSRLDIPVYGYFFRLPRYGLSGFDRFGSFHAPPWKFQRIDLQIGIERKLSTNPNKCRIYYGYEYYHYRENEVYQVNNFYHYLGFTWLMRRK